MKKLMTIVAAVLIAVCSQAQTYVVPCPVPALMKTYQYTLGTNYTFTITNTNNESDVYALLNLLTSINLAAGAATNAWTLYYTPAVTNGGRPITFRLGTLASDVSGSESAKAVNIAPPLRYGDTFTLIGDSTTIASTNTKALAVLYKMR